MTLANPRCALAQYRRRWTVETLFANLKANGFNMEDTHITGPGKLSTLLAVLAMAVALCVKTGAAPARIKSIPVKKHGRKAYSIFALGLHALRKSSQANIPFMPPSSSSRYYPPTLPLNPLKYIAI